MLQVTTVSARRLPIPAGSDKYFIATLSVGDVTVSTAPVKPVLDARLGASVTFRDTLDLPCPIDASSSSSGMSGGPNAPPNVAVQIHIRSVCGSLYLGSGICRVTKQWAPMVPSGEVLCGFMLQVPVVSHPPPPVGVPSKKRPVTAGPSLQGHRPASGGGSSGASTGGASSSAAGLSTESLLDDSLPGVAGGEYAGELAIKFDRVRGLGLPATAAVSLYAQVQFAQEEKQSGICEATPEGEGHAGRWPQKTGGDVVFEVLPSNLTRVVTIMMYASDGKAAQKHNLVGIAKLDVATNLGGENHRDQKTLVLSGHPRSRLSIEYALVYSKPRKEGASGRPLSAYPRRTSGGGAAPAGTGASTASASSSVGGVPALAIAPSAVSSGGGAASARMPPALDDRLAARAAADEQLASSPNSSASKLRNKVGAGRKAWEDTSDASRNGSGSSGGNGSSSQQQEALGRLIAERLEERIAASVERAVSRVLDRLAQLEVRVQRTEEMIGQLRPPSGHHANRKVPRAPSSQGAASRPSSADSVTGPNYDVSQSIVSEMQLRAKFAEYENAQSGLMTLAQLIHFYRAGSMFGDDDDEARVLRFFETLGIRVQCTNGITFDEFAKVALKLAAR